MSAIHKKKSVTKIDKSEIKIKNQKIGHALPSLVVLAVVLVLVVVALETE